MYIQDRLFSETHEGEVLYSVLMTSEEYEVYQREFARKDYEGLNKAGKEALKKERGKIAKSLLEDRSRANSLKDNMKAQSALINSGRGTEFFDKLLGVDPDPSVKFTKKEQEALAKNDLYKGDVKRANIIRNNSYESSIKFANDRANSAKKDVISNQAKELKESISKHEAKAKELRKIKNIKKGAAIAAGATAAAGLAAYGAKKLADKKKAEKEDK